MVAKQLHEEYDMQFGSHIPTSEKRKSQQSPVATFTRGLQLGGSQWKFKFDNGYGASVINDGYGASVINDGYGGEAGLYELAVLDSTGRLTYGTPVTDDVLGCLSETEVAEALDAIAALPAEVTA